MGDCNAAVCYRKMKMYGCRCTSALDFIISFPPRDIQNDVVHDRALTLAVVLIYIHLDIFGQYIHISHLLINASSLAYYVRRCLSHC